MGKGTVIEKLFLSLGLDMSALDADLLTASKTVQQGMTTLNTKAMQAKLRMDIDMSRFKGAENSAEALTTKTKHLNDQLAIQKQQVQLLNASYQQSVVAKTNDSAAGQKLLTRLLREQKAEADLTAQIKQTNAARQAAVSSSKIVPKFDTSSVKGVVDSTSASIASLKTQLATVFAVVTSGGGIFATVKGAIEAGDAAYRLQTKMNMSAADAGALNKILKMSDIDAQSFITTIIRLDKTVLDAGSDGNLVTNTLKEFGVSLKDDTGKLLPYNQQLAKLAEGYREAAKTGQEAEFVTGTLGSKGAALVPMLQDYTENMEAASRIKSTSLLDPKLAHEMSIEMKVLNGEVGQLKMAFGAALLPVAKEIAPEVISGLQAMVEGVKKNKTEIVDVGKGIIEISKDVASAIKGIGGALSPVVSGFEKLNSATNGGTGEVVKTGVEIWAVNKGLTAMSAALKLPIPGWAKLAVAVKIATGELFDYIKAKQQAEDVKISTALGSTPDADHAKIRKNPSTGKLEKETLVDQNIYPFTKKYYEEKFGDIPKVKRWAELSAEELKIVTENANKEEIMIARRKQLETIVEASTGKPLTKERIDETIKDEFDEKYSTEKWKKSQETKLEQKKLFDKEVADAEKLLQTDLFKLTHSNYENSMRDIEEKYKTQKKILGESVALTAWAEAAKVELTKETYREINNKIFQAGNHSNLEFKLHDIEIEKTANIKKIGDVAKAEELAELERKKARKDAQKDFLADLDTYKQAKITRATATAQAESVIKNRRSDGSLNSGGMANDQSIIELQEVSTNSARLNSRIQTIRQMVEAEELGSRRQQELVREGAQVSNEYTKNIVGGIKSATQEIENLQNKHMSSANAAISLLDRFETKKYNAATGKYEVKKDNNDGFLSEIARGVKESWDATETHTLTQINQIMDLKDKLAKDGITLDVDIRSADVMRAYNGETKNIKDSIEKAKKLLEKFYKDLEDMGKKAADAFFDEWYKNLEGLKGALNQLNNTDIPSNVSKINEQMLAKQPITREHIGDVLDEALIPKWKRTNYIEEVPEKTKTENDFSTKKIEIDEMKPLNENVAKMVQAVQDMKGVSGNEKTFEPQTSHASDNMITPQSVNLNISNSVSFAGFTGAEISGAIERAREAFGRELASALASAKMTYEVK